MKRIRLQVGLLPWTQSASPPSSCEQSRQAPLKPWLHVCTEEITLQELADQIVQKFAKIYAGFGDLSIQHLESDYGEILDLTDTVGDVFDDRAPSGESRTSIVRVACVLTDGHTVRTSNRFGSLTPESSARPLKRPLEQSSPPAYLRNSSVAVPTIENWSSQDSSITVGRVAKRRRRTSSKTSIDINDSSQEIFQSSSQVTPEEPLVQVNGTQQDQIKINDDAPSAKAMRFAMELAKRGTMEKLISRDISFKKEDFESVPSAAAGGEDGSRSWRAGSSRIDDAEEQQVPEYEDRMDARCANAFQENHAADTHLTKQNNKDKKKVVAKKAKRVSPNASPRLYSSRNISKTPPQAFSKHQTDSRSRSASSLEIESNSDQDSNDAPIAGIKSSSASPMASTEPLWRLDGTEMNESSTARSDVASMTDLDSIADESSISSPPSEQTRSTESLHSISDLSSEDSDVESDPGSIEFTPVIPIAPVPLTHELRLSPEVGTPEDFEEHEQSRHPMNPQWPLTPPSTNNTEAEDNHLPKRRGSNSPVKSLRNLAADRSPLPGQSTSEIRSVSPPPERFRYPKFSEIKHSPKSSPPQHGLAQASERATVGQAHPQQDDQDPPQDDKETSDSESGLSSDSCKENWGPGMKGLQKLARLRRKFSAHRNAGGLP